MDGGPTDFLEITEIIPNTSLEKLKSMEGARVWRLKDWCRRFKSRIFQDFGNDFRAFGTLKLIKAVSKLSPKLFQSLKIAQRLLKSAFSVENDSNFSEKCEI